MDNITYFNEIMKDVKPYLVYENGELYEVLQVGDRGSKICRKIDNYIVNSIYNQALEDFKNLCLKHKSKDEYPIMCFDEFTINRFAEQLKK